MNALRDKYAIVGTGKSRLGQVGANSLALLEEAIKNALVEAGLTNKDIDGMELIFNFICCQIYFQKIQAGFTISDYPIHRFQLF